MKIIHIKKYLVQAGLEPATLALLRNALESGLYPETLA